MSMLKQADGLRRPSYGRWLTQDEINRKLKPNSPKKDKLVKKREKSQS